MQATKEGDLLMTSTPSRALANYPNRFDPAALGELPERLQSTDPAASNGCWVRVTR